MKKVSIVLLGLLFGFNLHTATAEQASVSSHSIEVYKSPYCGCCGKWITHLEENGFTVTAHDLENMQPVKTQFRIPTQLQSCHTGIINGYFIEGHVPASDIHRLLSEKPDIKGLTVPGMPAGTNVPGMETRPIKATFDVLAVEEDGTQIYSHYE